MNDIQKNLETSLGLSATEAQIYVTCLPHAALTVPDVVKCSGIKRTTAYHALDTLVFKGLASKKHVGNKISYAMLAPSSLEHRLRAEKHKIEVQESALQKIIPELELIKKEKLFNTRVEHYQGVAGVKAVYEEALYCKSRHWDTITSLQSFLGLYGPKFHEYVNTKKRERGLHARELWEEEKFKKPQSPYGNPGTRDIRIMPRDMQNRFKSKIIIFDNKIALITPPSDAGAVLITSEELLTAFQAVFDTIWTISKPVTLPKIKKLP